MKIVYIAHPIGGDVLGNLTRVRNIVREINLDEPGVVPFAPYYADCMALKDHIPAERLRGIANDIAIIKTGIVDELRLYGDRISAGMLQEIEAMAKLGIPIKPMTRETEIAFKDVKLPPYRMQKLPRPVPMDSINADPVTGLETYSPSDVFGFLICAIVLLAIYLLVKLAVCGNL